MQKPHTVDMLCVRSSMYEVRIPVSFLGTEFTPLDR